MGISELRQIDPQPWHRVRRRGMSAQGHDLPDLSRHLVQSGTISYSDAELAQTVQSYCDAPLDRVLLAEGLADGAQILRAQAARANLRLATPEELAGGAEIPEDQDARHLIKAVAAPLRGSDGVLRLAVSNPDIALADPALPTALQNLPRIIAPRRDVQNAIAGAAQLRLAADAQARTPVAESCRTWDAAPTRRIITAMSAMTACAALTMLFPTIVFTGIVAWATLTLLLSTLLKSACVWARVGSGAPREVQPPLQPGTRLPKVSVLVPLFRETEIAHALITRLTRLTYPKCLLDVILVLEEKDDTTRQTLAQIDLPPWMRAVVVPDGQPRTKPRAMNYALDFCEGDIVGIFDAEDAPDPDQITQIARRFSTAPPDVACLQGILDYYNPRQNWLARCFTIEYATWFRVMMPGLAHLGFAIPLGGTTLYFRRNVLEELGGWDAHNVTEDADLGFRLARHGYRTEMIGTVTDEEANCRPWPWIKQRSRWLKGYATT